MGKQFDILIVDDEQVIIDSITKLCAAEGLRMDSALDGSVGLKKLRQNTYSVVICDIMMPDLNGFQFLNELRSQNIPTPIIMTTGYSTVENAVKSLNSGAIDYLAKPFTVEELLSTVHRGLNYQRIMNLQLDKSQESIPYALSPAAYYQLGFSTWAFVEEDGSLKIGVTDLFLKTINKIIAVEMFDLEQELVQGNACAHFETDDHLIHNILSPISGKIIGRNEMILKDYRLIEKDPYLKGWIYTIIPSDLEYELKSLTPDR